MGLALRAAMPSRRFVTEGEGERGGEEEEAEEKERSRWGMMRTMAAAGDAAGSVDGAVGGGC